MIRNNNSNLYIPVFYFLICLKATLILPFYELNAENIEKLKFHEKSMYWTRHALKSHIQKATKHMGF